MGIGQDARNQVRELSVGSTANDSSTDLLLGVTPAIAPTMNSLHVDAERRSLLLVGDPLGGHEQDPTALRQSLVGLPRTDPHLQLCLHPPW